MAVRCAVKLMLHCTILTLLVPSLSAKHRNSPTFSLLPSFSLKKSHGIFWRISAIRRVPLFLGSTLGLIKYSLKMEIICNIHMICCKVNSPHTEDKQSVQNRLLWMNKQNYIHLLKMYTSVSALWGLRPHLEVEYWKRTLKLVQHDHITSSFNSR